MINEELYNQEDVELLDGVADGADEGDEMYEHMMKIAQLQKEKAAEERRQKKEGSVALL